jgi:hypothetical protein
LRAKAASQPPAIWAARLTGRRLVARVTPKPKVAYFCAAQWPVFTPPLTVDVLSGQIVPPSNLGHRRTAHSNLGNDRPLLTIGPSTSTFYTRHDFLSHVITIANDVVNDVNNDSVLAENPPLHKAVATGWLRSFEGIRPVSPL